jgi:hypothetical protein
MPATSRRASHRKFGYMEGIPAEGSLKKIYRVISGWPPMTYNKMIPGFSEQIAPRKQTLGKLRFDYYYYNKTVLSMSILL